MRLVVAVVVVVVGGGGGRGSKIRPVSLVRVSLGRERSIH